MTKNLQTQRYWRLPKGGEIPEISQRMERVCSGADPGPADLGPEFDIERAKKNADLARERKILPHRKALEKEFSENLSWISTKLGESEAMRLVEKDWLIVGKTIVFGSEQPSYNEVKEAVNEAISRREQTLKTT